MLIKCNDDIWDQLCEYNKSHNPLFLKEENIIDTSSSNEDSNKESLFSNNDYIKDNSKIKRNKSS